MSQRSASCMAISLLLLPFRIIVIELSSKPFGFYQIPPDSQPQRSRTDIVIRLGILSIYFLKHICVLRIYIYVCIYNINICLYDCNQYRALWELVKLPSRIQEVSGTGWQNCVHKTCFSFLFVITLSET